MGLSIASAQAWAVKLFGWGLAVYRRSQEDGLDYRAMGLVYTSLLALIPLLAVSFAMLKAFGADAYLEPVLLEIFSPLGGNAGPVAAYLLDSVRRLEVGLLGSVGLLSLLYTSVSLLDKIEESFNHVWRRKGKSSRSLLRRFSDYLSFILVGPLLVFSAFGGMGELFRRAHEFVLWEGGGGLLLPLAQALLPYLFTVAAFAFLYRAIPDAPVSGRSAWFGAVLAGLSWKLVGWIFASFMAGSAQYPAVYSTFAILILSMVWLYLSWLIILLGVQVAFFHQNPRYLALRDGQARLSARLAERLGVLLMVLVGRRFLHGERPWRVVELAERLALPDDCVAELLSALQANGFIMAAGGVADAAVAPARDLATIALADVVDAMRRAHEGDFPLVPDALAEPLVDGLVGRIDGALREAVGSHSLRDLIVEGET